MEKEQKNKISHRYRAIEKFMEFLDGGDKKEKDGSHEEKLVEKKEHENGTEKEKEEDKEKEEEEKK